MSLISRIYNTAPRGLADRAVREVMKAKKAWLKTAQEEGKLVPRPKYRPAIYREKKRRPDKERTIQTEG